MAVFVPFSLAASKVFWYIFPFFIPFSILLGILFKFFYKKNKFLSVVVFLVLLLVANYQSLKIAANRDFGTRDVKKLANRNRNVYPLVVIGRAYESVLFYFDSGNIDNKIKGQKYLILTKDKLMELTSENSIKDNEGDLYLYKLK
jgi:hypothetical protein